MLPAVHLRSSPRLTVALLGGALAIELGVLVYWGAFDSNEGWYSLYPSLVLDGKVPYRDFFYHRLPLLPFVFSAAVFLPVSRLLAIRVLCGAFTWIAWVLSAAVAEIWTGTSQAKMWVLVLAVASLYGNSYLVTAQSYAPFAMLVAGAIWLISRGGDLAAFRFAAAGLALATAMGLRFGPDALLLVVPAAALLGIWRPASKRNLLVLGAAFGLGVATIIAVSASWDAGAFLWSVFIWPFKSSDYYAENGFRNVPSDVSSHARLKATFAIRAVQVYLPVVLVALVAAAVRLQRRFGQSRRQPAERSLSDVELFALIIVASEILFFFLPADSGVMQYSFILPVAAACCVTFACRAIGMSTIEQLSRPTTVVLAAAVALAGCSDRVRMSCSWRNPDIAALGFLGDKLRDMVGPDQYVVTFDPVLPAEANRQIFPGFEFEMYGFLPRWDDQRVKRYRLLNWPTLKQAVTSPRTGAVVLSQSRWRDDVGMGLLLRPYRPELTALLAQSTDRAIDVVLPSCVGVGPIQIYTRTSRP